MEENTRIPENLLPATFADGDILTNLDVNKIISILSVAINANYEDIKTDKTDIKGVSDRLKDGTFSKSSETTLQNNDTMFPSSRQVKNYVDNTVAAIVSATLTSLAGYDAETTQVLKNINGVLTWVTEE